ncbi:hypothetical protein [Actinopolymorpha pittospori]|uniref:Uncharacterized protein n=1 Tax=Actinopolymorpha pittospori TaxID=648752 RepID=A0A927N620_9ACTN|nr:hypothetical protein [Actinopolymorpha pittospori]MBE1609160.1 hypothetical protein [Actinopolymorpha pittospori]
MHLAGRAAVANDTLVDRLTADRSRARHNRHNLDVFSSIAALFAQNLHLLLDLARVDDELRRAESLAREGSVRSAVACVDLALDLAHSIRRDRNDTLRRVLDVWAVSRHLKTPKANGRELLHAFDDVKDHLPDRTTDMSYLILRQLLLPLDEWFERLRSVRNHYADAHGVPVRNDSLNWAAYGAHE